MGEDGRRKIDERCRLRFFFLLSISSLNYDSSSSSIARILKERINSKLVNFFLVRNLDLTARNRSRAFRSDA